MRTGKTMKSLLRIRKIYLCKLVYNELNIIKCKLPVTIEKINNENTSKVLNFRDINVELNFNHMLNKGETGVYGVLNNETIAHAWCIVNKGSSVNKIQPFYKTNSKIAYIHFCNVKEEHRGNDIYPYVLYNLIKIVSKNYDIDTFYIDTDYNNKSSQHGINKLGFKLYKKYTFVSILNHFVNRHILK